MTTTREQILELVASGKLSPADAEKLLASQAKRPARLAQWVVNPAAHFSTSAGLAISSVVALVGVALSRAGVRFSGPLSTQTGTGEPVSWDAALLDVASSWLLPALLFWSIAFVFSRRARWADFLVTVGLARAPGMLAAAASLQREGQGAATPEAIAALSRQPSFLVLLLLLLVCLSWQVTMLALGFKTASGLRGARWVSAFVIGLAVSEVLGIALRGLR